LLRSTPLAVLLLAPATVLAWFEDVLTHVFLLSSSGRSLGITAIEIAENRVPNENLTVRL
jgi:hypothetical protein